MGRFTIALLTLLTTAAQAQSRWGVEAGAGMPVFNLLSKNNNVTTRSFFTPALEVNYMRSLNKWVNVGAKLAYQRYNFAFAYNKSTSAGLQTDGVHTKANYLFLAPIFDLGIGKKQIVHAYVSPAAGYLLGGEQVTNDFLYGSGVSGNSFESSDAIEKLMFRLNLGLEECVWQNTSWRLVLNEGFSLISTPVTTLPTSKTDVRPGYAYVQVGIMKQHTKTRTPKGSQ